MGKIDLNGVIGTGGSLLGGLFGGLFGNYQQKKANEYNQKMLATQYEYNKQLAELEYQRNVEQWRRENDYNIPSQQLARLQQAGINPHIAYSKGSINNVSASSPQYNAPSYGYESAAIPDTSGYITAGQAMAENAVRAYTENANLAAQGDFIRAQTANKLLEAAGKTTDNEIKSALKADVIRQGQLQTDLMQQNVNQAVQKYEILVKENQLKAYTFDDDVDKVKFLAQKLEAEVQGQMLLNDLRRQQKDANLPEVQRQLTWWQAEAIARTGGFTGDAATVYLIARLLGIDLTDIPEKLRKTFNGVDKLNVARANADKDKTPHVAQPMIGLR